MNEGLIPCLLREWWGSVWYLMLALFFGLFGLAGGSSVQAQEQALGIALGDSHTCAIKTDGTVACWGSNEDAQLGLGYSGGRVNSPTAVPGLTNVVALEAGSSHTCALRANGMVACWGNNFYGQLGLGDMTNRSSPTLLGLTSVEALAAQAGHTCAITSSGTVLCWGHNYAGQLGLGDTTNRTYPRTLTGLDSAAELAAGVKHTCALKTNGTVYCWGWNDLGQLGLGNDVDHDTPTMVPGLTDVTALAGNRDHNCVLEAGGTVACWGNNEVGELGLGSSNEIVTSPTEVPSLFDVAALVAGGHFTFALKTDGVVAGWGGNWLGQLGLGDTFNRTSPTVVPDLTDLTKLAAGGVHTCAVRSDGTLDCWGSNSQGQLGLGYYGGTVTSPTPVPGFQSFTVGGTVSGLTGAGLVLQNNGGDDLEITANDNFTFPTALLDASSYDVSVLTQPSNPSQTCSVTNGTGTLAGANITDVEVTCTTNQFTVGGSVSGLSGSGLVLQNNGGEDLPITADGNFTFSPQDDGTAYSVTVATQPSDLSQTCTVTNGDGTLATANVTDVEVTCETNSFTVGGTVSGLEGEGLVLQNDGEDDITITDNGSFAFPTALLDGSSYAVTILTQPGNPSQTCSITNDTGTLAGADITDVQLACETNTYIVSTVATNGTITSVIDPEIEDGQTTMVTGVADADYYLASVSGCSGIPQSNTDQSVTSFSYETGQITDACTVEAVFAIKTYTVSETVQGAGTVDVLTPVVSHGDDAEFSVTPNSDWSLRSFVGDTCTPTDNGDGMWAATNITADCATEAAFVENTITHLTASASPALVGESITYTIAVIGSASAPTDGEVTLSSDSDGLICTIGSADSSSGKTAMFSCQHTWTAAGTHLLIASFSGSDTHADSDDSLQQVIVADEFIFPDRFEVIE